MTPLARTLEALLFLSSEPVAAADLAEAAECDADELAAALDELREAYAPGERGLVLRELAGGLTLATSPETEVAARRLLAKPRTPPLTQAQADLLARRAKDLHDWRRVLRPVLIALAVICALVLREPDLDSTIVLGLIATG